MIWNSRGDWTPQQMSPYLQIELEISLAHQITYFTQQRRLELTTNEPLFTNCTRDFIGTLDYIFYTADSLTVESLLELLDEKSLRKDTALPSPE
ncbi:hypothetical protein SLA2020_281200 [Shorea laevis]